MVYQLLIADKCLLVASIIHEIIVLALLVEVLHLPFLDVRLADLVAALEGGLQHPPRKQTADAGSDESRALSGFDVLELDDFEGFAVDLNLQALPEVRSVNHAGHASRSPSPPVEWMGV